MTTDPSLNIRLLKFLGLTAAFLNARQPSSVPEAVQRASSPSQHVMATRVLHSGLGYSFESDKQAFKAEGFADLSGTDPSRIGDLFHVRTDQFFPVQTIRIQPVSYKAYQIRGMKIYATPSVDACRPDYNLIQESIKSKYPTLVWVSPGYGSQDMIVSRYCEGKGA